MSDSDFRQEKGILRRIVRKTQLANVLTVLRAPVTFAAVPSFLPALETRMPEWWWGFGVFDVATEWGQFWQGALLFVFAAVLDFLDGSIARWAKSESAFGKFADPFCDKVMNWTMFVIVTTRLFPFSLQNFAFWWLPLSVMAKLDWTSTGKHWEKYQQARSSGRDDKAAGAIGPGKVKMVLQTVLLVICVCVLCPEAPDAESMTGRLSDNLIRDTIASMSPMAYPLLWGAMFFGYISVEKRK